MKKLSWNRIAILYENDTYGRDGALSLHKQSPEHLMCVSKLRPISVSNKGDVSLEQMNTVLDEIMLQNPVVEGVVLFASKQVAQKVLIAVENKGVTNVPLFILPESVGVQDDVFRLHGSIMEKTKGSLSVSLPYTEITSFTDYWMSLVTNMTMFAEKAGSNPWLNDVFAAVTNCERVPVSSCDPLTTEQAKLKFPVQPLHVKYVILAVHTMVKVLQQVYNDLCPNNSPNCLSEFKNKFKPYMMIDRMKDLTINFGTDFNSAVTTEPLTSSQYQVTFGNMSEPMSTSDHDIYHVYNYQKSSDVGNENDFNLLKVCMFFGNRER